MTETRAWVERRRAKAVYWLRATVTLFVVAGVAAGMAVGVWIGRGGWYQRLPLTVLVGWVAAFLGVWLAIRWYRRANFFASAIKIAEEVELRGKLRRGAVTGIMGAKVSGSSALLSVADDRSRAWLNDNGSEALDALSTRERRSFGSGAAACFSGLLLFFLAGPAAYGANDFFHPLGVLGTAWRPVDVSVDRDQINRGDSVTVSVRALGRAEVTFWERSRGEPWTSRQVSLDSVGMNSFDVGPLVTDRFFRVSTERRSSRTIQVHVALPALLSDLVLAASFPLYLDRPDEPLYQGDTVFLPVGTRLSARGRATVELDDVAWHVGGDTVGVLEVDGQGFEGIATVRRSGLWQLAVVPRQGALAQVEPALHVVAVPDSAPVVTIPVPGQDTLAQTNLRQLLVIDARDDHGITDMTVTSNRVTRTGFVHEDVAQRVLLPAETTDRAVVQWMLDLTDRGFLPGDTAYYSVSVSDNAPRTRTTTTITYALLIPASSEMRESVRDQANQLVQDADSLAQAQRELQEQTENLARQQEAAQSGNSGDEQLDFETAEEAAELRAKQEALAEQAQALAEAMEKLQDAGWEAGLTDPEWHERMEELRELMENAVTPEMMESMDQLGEALERLDAEAVREALEQMARAQEQMEEQLERNRDLMERAALESAMTTLAEDAEELTSRQEQWQNALEQQTAEDSALAAEENLLAEEAEQLEENLERLNQQTEERSDTPSLEAERQQAQTANQQMRQAAQQTSSGQKQEAQQSGENAQQQLESLSENLQDQLEQMREDWREEVLGMMDQALVETADLAQRQVSVAEKVLRGETGDDVRGEQTALREGLDRVIERLQDAAGKNALVSPNLSTALGFSRLQMTEALQELQEAMPNSRQAGQRAAQALDGLNEVAYALVQNRSGVEESQSGSGMSEMMEQMAEMADQQQSMAADANSMLPMMSTGNQELLQQLQQMAEQQRSLGEELERMDAEGAPSGTEDLADEAMEVAREIEAGRLDRATVERQERLFRRLLDAGRTLRNDEEEEEEREERESETADPTNIRPPETFDSSVLNDRPPVPYPNWEQLRRFTPEERRLILDYFRRLNDARRRP